MSKRKIKVGVGMSGGVDSSVTAKILKDQGYDVVGFMMKLWADPACRISRDNSCCDPKAVEDARKVAQKIGVPFYLVDVRETFKKEVADYFIDEYKNLRTPNPCVVCNEKIKFGWLLDFAKSTGCEFLATGHYTRIAEANSRKYQISNIKYQKEGIYHLLKGKDEKKDQSYFLYRLNQEQLSKILFPLGELRKEEVRKLAKKWNLPVYEKKESQEVCFIKDRDYREFLKRHIPEEYFKEGEIVNIKGDIVGTHQGLINYTIGQRKGVNQCQALVKYQISNIKYQKYKSNIKNKGQELKDKQPMYVVGFNVKKNRLIVGEDKDLFKRELVLDNMHFIKPDNDPSTFNLKPLTIKIRYRAEAVPCSLILNTRYLIRFNEPQRAITPGQSAVLYNGDEVVGGGVIE